MFKYFILLFFIVLNSIICIAEIYNVDDFGGIANDQLVDTKAIQEAINKCHENGGGTVYFPAGKYISGSIVLKDNVILRLEVGAVLAGSLNMEDYPKDLGKIEMIPGVFFGGPLIYAENAKYIGIEGKGIIDGRGTRENFEPMPPTNYRPGLIRFKNCQFVSIEDISLVNSARWTLHLRECEDVSVHNIYLNSNVNRNNDGIDVDGCSRVRINSCTLNAEDDAIVLKSYKQTISSDIVIADCIISSTCSAIKIGTETVGLFRNISVSNCSIFGSRGIDLYTVDGADIENVTISNISMRDCKSAIQLRIGDRLRQYNMSEEQRPKTAGRLQNVMISHVQAINIEESQDFISGIPGHKIENLILSDINISYKGGGTLEQAEREIPEVTTRYPKIGMFGDLPSYGFFIRHVKGITLRNINLKVQEKDIRPAIVCEDVQDMKIIESEFDANDQMPSVIRFNQVENAMIKGTQINGTAKIFLETRDNSKNIILSENILENNVQVFEEDETVNEKHINEFNNLILKP